MKRHALQEEENGYPAAEAKHSGVACGIARAVGVRDNHTLEIAISEERARSSEAKQRVNGY